MPLTYLKVEPEIAVNTLETCVSEGYGLKDTLEQDYFIAQNKTTTPEKIKEWSDKANQWANATLQKLAETFINSRQQYNFRDAPTSPMARVGVNIEYEGIIKNLQARIDVLNEYINFIFQHSSIQIVAGRDATVQIGGSQNKQEIKNER